MSQDFDKIFGQNSSLTPYTWSDTDYQKGWETVGQTPPARTMFDALQRKNDLKAKELHDTLTPIAENADAHSRKGGTAYAVGDVMESSLLPIGYSLLCTTAGTTSSNVITIPSPLVEGATITDGTVVWTIIKTPTQRSLGYRQPSATVAVGAIAYSESLPPSYYLECTTAGTTGTGALTISTVTLGSTVSDGTAVWEIKSWQYLGKALAESTGYGIVSGCTPTISGLTVTVAAGVVHLAGGTRKELAATTVTLDTADSTNPRIDLVYISSAGVVAKATGTAAASPSVPALHSGGISVATVSVAANASTGTLTDSRDMLARWQNTGIVNVKDYGAAGDGVTDDTVAFRAALLAAKGNILIVPDGNYNITANLFADDVNDVIDNGTYTYIKPVYPKKEAFVKDLNMLKYVGTIPYSGADAASEYQQGFGINRNTGKLLAAGVKGTYVSQTIYEVANDAVGTVINSYSYSTLGHANTITHCPELGQFIVDDCTDANTVHNYSVIDASTMVADTTQKTLPFQHFGISWDPVCKLFVCSHQPGGYKNITLHVCDINFNLLRTVSVSLSADINLLNGGCCYDGTFFAPSLRALSEVSILGKEIKIHQIDAWELEDCDVYDGKFYMAVGSFNGQCDVYVCDGTAVYNDSITVKTFDKNIPQNSSTLFPSLGRYILQCEVFVSNKSDMPFGWTDGLLKVTRDAQGNIRQTLYKSASYEIAVRYLAAGGGWSAWQKLAGTFGIIDGTPTSYNSLLLDGRGPTKYDFSPFGWAAGSSPTAGKDGPVVSCLDKNGTDLINFSVQALTNGVTSCGLHVKYMLDTSIWQQVWLSISDTSNRFAPERDNITTLGYTSHRWSVVYSATATISTSDERLKDNISEITDDILDTWGEVKWCQFKFKDAIEEKGEEARIHNGLIAQRIQKVFEAHNLDVSRYGLFCYDEWEAEEVIDSEGNVTREAKPAGNRYSLRYEECLAMEAAYQRRRADRLEARIAAIEERLNMA